MYAFHIIFICLVQFQVLLIEARNELGKRKRRPLDRMVLEQDSDYFYIYKDITTLPHLDEWGVFAKYDIPANEIICEYRGQIVYPEHAESHPGENRYFDTYLVPVADATEEDLMEFSIRGNTICSLINDAVLVLGDIDGTTGAPVSPYTHAELDAFEESGEYEALPLVPGFAYNANYTRSALGKIFIVSTKPIPAGTEIFYPYGM
jgi:hypothetical protein